MHRTAPLAAAILAAMLVLGGCSTTVAGHPSAGSGPAPTAGPGSDPVAWVDGVCGAALALVTPAVTRPDVGESTDLAVVQRSLSGYLGGILTGAQQARTQLDAVGAAPVEGGDAVVTKLRGALDTVEKTVGEARAAIDKADPRDPAGFAEALGSVQTALGDNAAPDAIGDLVAVPDLNSAASKAPKCQQLRTVAGSPS